MKPIENNKQNFTQVNDSLRRISVKKINSTQKIFFGYIIGWQKKGKTLTAKNKYIADQLGLTESGIRKAISTSKKFDFFSSKQLGNKKGENGYTSTHEIKIDVDKFEKYLKLNHSKTAFYENLDEPENGPDEVQEPNQPSNVKKNENSNFEFNKIQFEKIELGSFGPNEFHKLTNDRFSYLPINELSSKLRQIRGKDTDENGCLYNVKRLIDELLIDEQK